ncbi:histidine phosphatase superfamily [Elsinoe ampelina]|uniref:Histidine phosphatase superfamily n=1 Tax=Elsinoe ampelina TaxID=302913 RepID=A0A6A6GD04_9PEZI|nr:histidine phosphatase superfamily [Elsinoe ampelina]
MAAVGHSQDVNSTSKLWAAPAKSDIDDLSTILNRTGVYGFVFNSSQTPESIPYSTYNWCNMPHVRAQEYPRANSSFTLEYVEVIHRHHKRTPYAANTFPVEAYGWDCSDQGLFYYGSPLPVDPADTSASTYWSVYNSTSNPLRAPGFPGNCQFPQITTTGLRDSHQHGLDLASVYKTLLGFLPDTYEPKLSTFRVTSNTITSQVASSLIPGLYPALSSAVVPLLIQPAAIDSLQPSYSCPASSALYRSYASGATTGQWQTHLDITAPLYATLDTLSGVSPTSSEWHVSWDHYYDNLSARLCHALPLPCSSNNTDICVTQGQADTVFRLGQWEYSYTYRAAGPDTLRAAVSGYGIWIAELADTLRNKAGLGNSTVEDKVKYRHNVAHDGSVSRLLSILQVDRMVWPGMGAEVVFELFSREAAEGTKEWFVRVLWGGQILRSSSPALGVMDMVPLKQVLEYFDGLVGQGAHRVPGLCNAS